MFYGIVSSIFYSLCDIYYKKALELCGKLYSNTVYQVIAYSYLSLLLFVLVFVIDGFFGMSLFILGILLINSIITVICEYLEQYAFKNEKVSVLTPYGEIETLFSCILGFMIFSNSSFTAFIAALIAGATLFIGSINWKKMKINKYCLAMILSGFLTSLRLIFFGFVLLQFSELTTLYFSISFSFLIILMIFLFRRETLGPKKSDFRKNKFLYAEATCWIIANLITLYLIKNLGLVEAVLVTMSYLTINLLLSYFYFKDIPSKKDIFVVMIVTACIIFGIQE